MPPSSIPDPNPQLHTNPLVYVIAVVQFSAVLKMHEYVPAIQDVLRRQGFPLHTQKFQQSVTFTNNGMSMQTTPHWVFNDKQRQSGAIVSSSLAVLETTKYTTFEDFRKKLHTLLRSIGESVEGSDGIVVERIGLRYVNTLQPGENETFADLLHPVLMGPTENFLQLRNPSYQAELRGEASNGMLVLRSTPGNPEHPLPPDLITELGVEWKVEPNRPYQFLDVDHFRVMQQDFDADELVNNFSALHEATTAAFVTAIHPGAYEAWLNSKS